MNTYYFTFGHGHSDENYESLGHFYTTIRANTEQEARNLMYEKRGNRWCMCYNNPNLFPIELLRHVQFKTLTQQPEMPVRGVEVVD